VAIELIEEGQMNRHFLVSSSTSAFLMAVVLSAPGFVAAQSSGAAAKTDAKASKTYAKAAENAKPWTMPRTPDGHPDLQGYWTSLSFTPMERPAKYNGREFMTDAEMNEFFKEGVQHTYEFTFANSAETPVYDATVYGLGAWQNGVRPNRRTSLVVDPPDGKIPALTPVAAQARATLRSAAPAADADNGGVTKADVPADLGLGVRCLSFGGPPILPAAYNSNTHIVQGPEYVMVEYEWNSEARVIPTDGSAHVSSNIHPWHGDSRGHWEGDTLVVETTNFRPGATYQNANADSLKITERFTRIDKDTIEYKFTIDDPATWTKPWSAIVPLSSIEGPMFEYACNEGNNGLVNIMEGARVAEKAAQQKARGASGVPISQK
jgi:hypothetical protein